MAGLDELAGRTYGPFAVDTGPSRVSDVVRATGDDAARWTDHVPPSFANVVLFAAAPSFLDDPVVRPFTRSLIHSEQSFTWHRPLPVGAALEVRGTLDSIRTRGGIHLAAFSCAAASGGEAWVTGSSLFLLSEVAAAASADEPEPPAALRPPVDATPRLALPAVGASIATVGVGASRADLVGYAAATGDWNPIHWDHDAARLAGLSGTIVHGLLMTAWMGRVAARHVDGPAPLASLRARFRAPLRPAVAAEVTGRVAGVDEEGAELDLVLASGGERMVTARVRVTR